MINPSHLTDDLAHKVAHEVVCSCCKDELVRHARQGLIRGITTAIVQYIFKAKKPVVNFAQLFKRLLPHEKKMVKTMKRIWEKERRIIVANLKKLKKAWMVKDKIDNIVDSILYPTAPFEKEIAADMAGISVKVIDEQGTLIMDGLNVDVAFDVYNPEVTKWMKGYYPMLSKELETVNVEKLRRELITGLEAGEGIPQLTNRVNTTYANWNKVRSVSIARSESLRAANMANKFTYIQSGVVTKMTWASFIDHRTCDWCIDMDGKVISIEDNFHNLDTEYTVPILDENHKPKLDSDGNKRMHSPMKLNYTAIETPPLHSLCYDKETEVYTDEGWKLFKDLSKKDKCMSLDLETKEHEYVAIKELVSYKYKGDMLHFKTGDGKNQSDLLVTPNHSMVWFNKKNKLEFIRADKIDKKHYEIVPYNDMVYCVELEKFNTLWVWRDSGNACWSGNCRCSIIPEVD